MIPDGNADGEGLVTLYDWMKFFYESYEKKGKKSLKKAKSWFESYLHALSRASGVDNLIKKIKAGGNDGNKYTGMVAH